MNCLSADGAAPLHGAPAGVARRDCSRSSASPFATGTSSSVRPSAPTCLRVITSPRCVWTSTRSTTTVGTGHDLRRVCRARRRLRGRQRELDRRRIAGRNHRRGLRRLGDGDVERRGRLALAAADSHDLEDHVADARLDQPDLLRGRVREIDDAPADVRSAVVHAHAHGLRGLGIGDVEDGAERQRAMRGGEQRRIEDLAVRGRASGELLAVPAGHALQRLARPRLAAAATSSRSRTPARRHRQTTRRAISYAQLRRLPSRIS